MSFSLAGRQRLRDLIDQRCLITGASLTLSTGAPSSFYFDCKRATLHGECLDLITDAFLAEISSFPIYPDAIGGLTLGADFITATVVLESFRRGQPLEGSIARKEPKKHGTKTPIENELAAGARIVVVDDVITTGSSTRQAAEKFQEAGYEIVGIIALIDREAGGAESLAARFGCPVRSILRKRDFSRLMEGDRDGTVGQLAAALLAKRFYDEGRAFEDRIFDAQTNPHAEPISDEEESLYDALNAKRCINRELESLSGSRTLLLDPDTVEQQRKEMVQEKLRTRGTVPASIIADYANDA